MATMYTRNGWYYLKFVGPNKKRPTIALETQSESRANNAKQRIEELVSASKTGHGLSVETMAWLHKLTDEMRDKLASHDLIDKPEKQGADADVPLALGKHLDDYFAKWKDTKTSTHLNWSHTKRNLLSYFGAEKLLAEITIGDAKDFQRYLQTEARDSAYNDATKKDGLKPATVHKRITNARQFFQDAVDHDVLGLNPFARVKTTSGSNRGRDFFITPAMADKILEQCPSDEWRLLFALSRFGGLRCPSEHLALRLDAVDWEHNRLRVDSPKTEHHDGKAFRMIPLFPELRPYVEQAYNDAEEGATHFITRYRDAKQNLRTQLQRIIKRAGLEPWPKLWQNLRASRQTELEEQFPTHVVCTWIGNSESIARRHYLQVTDDHFAAAIEKRDDARVDTFVDTDAPKSSANEKATHRNPR